jgi:hypothetical protein
MVLESTQSLTEMSTRNLPGGKGRPALKADKLTDCLENVGASTSHKRMGLTRPVTGIALPFIPLIFPNSLMNKYTGTFKLFCSQLPWLPTVVREACQGGYDGVAMKFGWWRQEVFTEFLWGSLEGKWSLRRLRR